MWVALQRVFQNFGASLMRPVTPKPTTPRIGLWPLAINPEKNVVRFILLSLMAVVALSRRGVPARGRWRANARVRHAGPVRSRLRMAILTRELLVVRLNNVAIRAHRPVVRNAEKSMIENCAQPSRRHPRGVASDASCRIARRHVIWHVGAIRLGVDEVRLMAAVAVGGGIARGVVAPHVTIRAGVHHRPDRTGDRGARRQHMWTLERETRGTVVKLSIAPKDRVVAAQTHGRGEVRRNVIRHAPAKRRRALPRRLMAPVAIRIRRREYVIIADVAVRASVHLPRR